MWHLRRLAKCSKNVKLNHGRAVLGKYGSDFDCLWLEVVGEKNHAVLEEKSHPHEHPFVGNQKELPPVPTGSGSLVVQPKKYQDFVLNT
ncbi:hypothetical protein NDU88_002847 [Pleurodeles waltl]|uniref:Uncharacterized protein n=1 Tax=Pleurodeles waltl TaxID=8319 RepID=A0AAV7P7T5_PLEWA|nr:hypothetical protein NDU88_002847 [Pleurodeles waltl]